MRARTERSFLAREGRGLLLLAALWLGIFVLLPIIALIKTASGPAPAAVGSFLSEWTRPATVRASLNSLTTSALAMALSLSLGGLAAMIIGISRIPGRRCFAFLFTLSMLIAPHVAALAFKTLLGPASPVLQAFGLAPPPGEPNALLSPAGIILVLGLHHAPVVMLTLLSGLRQIPNQTVEAARMDGAGPARIVLTILMPLLAGHWLASGLIAFIAAFGNFGIPALLGLPINFLTLPTLMYRELTSFGPSVLPAVAGLALLTMLIASLAILATGSLVRANGEVGEGETGVRAFWTPGPIGSSLLVSLGSSLLLIALVFPLISLLAASLVPSYGVPLSYDSITIAAYVEVLLRQSATREAFLTSFQLAGAASLILASISVPMAYALERFAGRLRTVYLLLIDLPYALPGIVTAIAMILIFLKPLPFIGISLYGTPWIILLAYCARFLPLALKPALVSMAMLSPSVEEAGALCGARVGRRIVDLVTPALLPALAAGGLTIFLTAFTELTVSALLWSAGSRTVGVAMYGLEEAGQTTEASAMGIITIIVVGLVMLGLDRLAPRLPPGSVPWRPIDLE